MTPFNVRTSLMHPTLMHNDSDESDNVVQENNYDDDDSNKGDNVLQENSMQVAAQCLEDDTDQVKNDYANNEYVEPEISHPHLFEDDS